MNILVIGNGFDLAHGLPTSYKDFLSFIQIIQDHLNGRQLSPAFVIEYFKEFLRRKRPLESETININFDNIDISSYTKSLSDFSNVSKANFWMQHFFYKQKEMGDRWVDFEQEISDCVKIIENTPDDAHVDFINTFSETQEAMQKLIKNDVIKKLAGDLDDLNMSVELYMLLVNKIPIHKRKEFLTEDFTKYDHVINFNYTETIKKYNDDRSTGNILEGIYIEQEEKRYQKQGVTDKDTPPEVSIIDFIHGQTGMRDVILGAGETLEGDDINTKLSCVRFKKYFQRIHNKTGGKYRSWFNALQAYNVTIYGHSLDVTDKDILSYIILHELTAKVTIYYFEDDEKSNYEISIINLIQVIGKEELTARVGDGRIEFISTEDLGGKSVKAIV